MSFRKFRNLHLDPRRLLASLPRSGTAANRGKVLNWPEPKERLMFASYAARTTFLRRILPGMVTGAADVDPSLVITATVAGVFFGYQLLWVVLLCVPFLLTVFSVAARIGHETHRGLVHLLRDNYGARVAQVCAGLIVVINMAMIVADLMAVSDALSIIMDQRRIFFVAFVAFGVWYILIFADYHKITRALAFLALPLFIYTLAALFAKPNVAALAEGTFVPRLFVDGDYAMAVLGIFGSLLTPYVLVWQTSSRGESALRGDEFHESEHRTGTLVSTVLCFSIMVVAATILRGAALTGNLTTREAAEAFAPVAGGVGPVLFALGIIGAGMVALPVLVASLCYSVSEAMGWEYGLNTSPWEAKRFYVLISAALVIAATINFFRINPVKALYYSQILAGIFIVPILVFILLLSNDRRVMRTVNSRLQNFWIGAAAGGLASTGLLLVWASLRT